MKQIVMVAINVGNMQQKKFFFKESQVTQSKETIWH